MAAGFNNVSLVIRSFVFFLLFCLLQSCKFNYTLQPEDKPKNLKHIRDPLKKIKKSVVRTIQNPNGDIINCISLHQQLAFDHPLLKGQKPLDPPKWLEGHMSTTGTYDENFLSWTMSNESCPEGTIPIKRTTEEDILRASSIRGFGNELTWRKHKSEYAVGCLIGDDYYGAKASINVWQPRMARRRYMTYSQMRIAAWTNRSEDGNIVQVGWEVSPKQYGDARTRFFIHWTSDSYKTTGCRNLVCPGFVQTSPRVLLGGEISPLSEYDGQQSELIVHVEKDPSNGNWWLKINDDIVVGYWPSSLFTHLKDGPAMNVDIGGEIHDFKMFTHGAIEMGSGHFAEEGYKRASYIRRIQVVNRHFRLIPVGETLSFLANAQNCYSIQSGEDREGWGTYFYYGGPGKNPKCS